MNLSVNAKNPEARGVSLGVLVVGESVRLEPPHSLPQTGNRLCLRHVVARNVDDVGVRRVTCRARHPYINARADGVDEDDRTLHSDFFSFECFTHYLFLSVSRYSVSQPMTSLYPLSLPMSSSYNTNLYDIRHTPQNPLHTHKRTSTNSK